VQANVLSLSMHNPILIYSFLALYGVLTLMVLAYVHMRFRSAAKMLQMLQTQWASADSRHAGFVGKAQEQISKLAVPVAVAPVVKKTPVSFDMRNQVIALGKKGLSVVEIAKSCGMQEGDVDVLLGMARLQGR
jgi:hypothetical protein